MKKGRKILVVSLMLIAIVVSLFAFTACKDKVNPNEKTVTFIVVDEPEKVEDPYNPSYQSTNTVLFEKVYTTEKSYLIDLLNLAKDDKDTDFTFYSSQSQFGTSLDGFKVGDKEFKDREGYFVAQYTSLVELQYIMPGHNLFVKKVQYNSNGYGVDQMPLVDGATYVIAYHPWGS